MFWKLHDRCAVKLCERLWSFQTLFDEWFIGIYNVVYTSTPVLVLGFLEQVPY